jgi:hypothetical protein
MTNLSNNEIPSIEEIINYLADLYQVTYTPIQRKALKILLIDLVHEYPPFRPGDGIGLITAERARQMSVEGYSTSHDDQHKLFQLGRAALCYLKYGILPAFPNRSNPPDRWWPWRNEDWKPSESRIRNLVKAGALIAAEIDRLQREEGNGPKSASPCEEEEGKQ